MLKLKTWTRGEKGSAMIAALGIMLVLNIIAVSALAISASQVSVTTQERKGNQAFNIAEAGLNEAIWKINNATSYSPTISSPDIGTVQGGSYKVTIAAVTGNSSQRKITITGYSPDMTNPKAKKRTIEAIVEVAPTVLSFGMFTGGWVDQGGSPSVFFAPLAYSAPGARGADFGSNYEITFSDNGCRYNEPGSATYNSLFGSPAVPMGDIVTAGPNGRVTVKGKVENTAAELMADSNKVYIRNIVHLANPMTFPTFNFENQPSYTGSYKEMAALNTTNGTNNSPLGNGVYTSAQFATMLAKPANADLHLTGVIYVDGEVIINKNLTIDNGALIVKNTNTAKIALTVNGGAALKVNHTSEASKSLLGIGLFSAAGNKAKFTDTGTVTSEGIVYAETTVDLFKGNLTVKGCLLVKMAESSSIPSVFAKNGTVIIQYDPRVQATNGMTSTGNTYVQRVVSWKEINSP